MTTKIRTSARIVNLILLISFILFYLSLLTLFSLDSLAKLVIILGLIFLYIVLAILISRYLKGLRNPKKIILKEKKLSKKYVGSTESNTYHKKECRFSGMIKPEYLLENNDKEFFRKKKFKACKNCKPNRD